MKPERKISSLKEGTGAQVPQKRAAEIVGGIDAHDPFCSVTQLLFCLWDDLDKTGSRRLFSFSV